MAKKIVITSGKGGVGKTTVAVNLGYALAGMGQRVVLVDVDFGLNNLDVTMGLENKVVYDISDVLNGRCRVSQAIIQDRHSRNLYILPSDSLQVASQVSGQNLKLLTESLAVTFDYILFDCPAGIDVGFHRAVACADEALVVTTPNLTSLRDADKVVSILRSYKMDKIGLVVNRARGDLMMGDKMMTPEDVEGILQIKLVGVLPEEDVVFLSCGNTLPGSTDSKKAYKFLAQNVHKGSRKIFNVVKKYSGFFGSIRRSIKGSV